jgi:hypothetical protein
MIFNITYIDYLNILGYINLSIQNKYIDNIQDTINKQLELNQNIKNHTDIELNKKNTYMTVTNNTNHTIIDVKNIIEINSTKKCINIYTFDNLYFIFILLLILWKVIFIIIYSIMNKDIIFIFRNIYDFIIPLQYYIAKKYFILNHFDNIINKSLTLHPVKYNKFINYYSQYILITSIIFSFIQILTLLFYKQSSGYNIYSTIYNYSTKYTEPYIIILFFISNLYSINIFFSNAYIFSIVFKIHSYDIKSFYKEINNNLNSCPSELCNNMIRLRNEYEYSLELLNTTFSIIILFGCISTFIILLDLSNGRFNIFQYIYVFIFIIVLFVYCSSIILIKDVKNKLFSISYSNKIIEKLITRKNINKININGNQKEFINGINLNAIIIEKENADILDWYITYQILGAPWDTFKLFGFNIDDFSIFKKIIIIILTYYATNKLAIIFKILE